MFDKNDWNFRFPRANFTFAKFLVKLIWIQQESMSKCLMHLFARKCHKNLKVSDTKKFGNPKFRFMAKLNHSRIVFRFLAVNILKLLKCKMNFNSFPGSFSPFKNTEIPVQKLITLHSLPKLLSQQHIKLFDKHQWFEHFFPSIHSSHHSLLLLTYCWFAVNTVREMQSNFRKNSPFWCFFW